MAAGRVHGDVARQCALHGIDGDGNVIVASNYECVDEEGNLKLKLKWLEEQNLRTILQVKTT